MKRKKFKTRKRKRKNNFMGLIIILLLVAIIIVFYVFSRNVSTILMPYAELETKKIANIVINTSINKHITDEFNVDQLYTIIKDDTGKIQTVSFNTKEINSLMNKATNSVHLSLKAIEEGNIDFLEIPDNILVEYDRDNLKKGIVYSIPLGAISKNAFLANLGPKIPIRLKLVGSVVSDFKTDVQPYGVNNALIKIYTTITVEEMIIMPFVSKKVTISNDIPIDIKVITGEVPRYFQNGQTFSSPQFSIPIDDN